MSTQRFALAGLIAVLLAIRLAAPRADEPKLPPPEKLFARENLVAWCIVPFDAKKRGPEERAAMMARLGFKHFAYDYRAEHIPTFDAEVAALKKHGIALDAWWFPTSLNDEAKLILSVLERHQVKAQLWVTGGGGPTKDAAEQRQRVEAEANRIRPIADAAAKIGCTVGLYNHGGWFGEPENQLAIIEQLKLPNVGIVYNQHHGHDHVDRFPALLAKMRKNLLCLNLNGMTKDGERRGQKILQLGQGELDLGLLKTIRDSGYRGPIGIIGHTQDDAEARLHDNLDGLDWLLPQVDGKPAGPKPKPRTPVPQPTASAAPKPTPPELLGLPLVAGRFGKALDPRRAAFAIDAKPDFTKPPLTVECWTKLESARGFNILVACQPKESADHWELYSYAGSGELSFYIPGFAPAEIKSGVAITDGKWHYVAATFDGQQVRLFVDAKLAKSVVVNRQRDGEPTGPLWIGAYPPQGIGCDGVLDEVRLSNTIRPLDRLPSEPFSPDEHTLGLWHLDYLDNQQRLRDASPRDHHAKPLVGQASSLSSSSRQIGSLPRKPHNHWGKEEVGFDWQESDSVDDRWKFMDTGQFFSGSINTPGQPTAKGIAIRLGDANEAAVCFDTDLLRFSCGWTGDFLKFDPARYGLIGRTTVAGSVVFTNGVQPGWAQRDNFADPRPRGLGPLPRDWGRYRGLYLHGNRVVLSYTVGGVDVLDSPWVERRSNSLVLTRSLEISPSREPLTMVVCAEADRAAIESAPAGVALATRRLPKSAETSEVSAFTVLTISSHEKPVHVKLSFASPPLTKGGQGGSREPSDSPGAKDSNENATARVLRSESDRKTTGTRNPPGPPFVRGGETVPDLRRWTQPGPARWTTEIVTRGRVSDDTKEPYVVDTLTLPFDNPYRALFFVSGHDFFKNGDAAICTAHGDVWRVGGIDDRLERLTWKRFATGLFQPLGLRIVDDVVHVVGRDQITRLHDRDGNAEADFYENFNNDGQVTLNGHEYTTCLETDAAGNFYYIKGSSGGKSDHDGCLLRVSRDGSKMEIVATGFRNANGLGIGPGDVITVAPQEGEWTPASGIFEVRAGGFYGAMPMHHRPQTPTDYDRPLCWIPRRDDNSSGGQVWVTSDRWGPLAGQLLHLSYGQCRVQLVLREPLELSPPFKGGAGGVQATPNVRSRSTSIAEPPRQPIDRNSGSGTTPPGPPFVRGGEILGRVVSQGGTVTLPLNFESGIMRGRFSPHDGQLYVSGLLGWTTSAAKDGCFERVRYTGRPVDLPVQARPMRNGLAITFTRPLDKQTAEDPDNYFVQQWNYLWSAAYGSPEYKVSDSKQQGRDEVEVRSATLLDDGRTVFLEMDRVQPVHQMIVKYDVKGSDGAALRQQLSLTIHSVPDREQPPESLVRRPRRGDLPADLAAAVVPGVLLKFRSASPLSPLGRGAGGEGRTARSNDSRSRSETPAPPLTPNPSPQGGEGNSMWSDARIARLLAWHVPAGSAVSSNTPPGPFEISASGWLRTTARGTYRVSLRGSGSGTLTINGAAVLRGKLDSTSGREGSLSADVKLLRGFNRVELSYRGPAEGDSMLRLLWGVRDETPVGASPMEFFPTEPVPPTAWVCDPRDDLLAQLQLVRNGRELFIERRCASCHTITSPSPAQGEKGLGSEGRGTPSAVPNRSPETPATHPQPLSPFGGEGSDAPDLRGIGSRLQREWLLAWLLDPRSMRNDLTMPRLFDARDAAARREAADVVAYLLTLPAMAGSARADKPPVAPRVEAGERPRGRPLTPGPSPPRGEGRKAIDEGAVLFEDLGCVGCHRFTAPSEKDEYERVSLHFVGRKFAEGQLVEFLIAPHEHFAANRMPDFKLNRDEAASLAGFVLDRATGRLPMSNAPASGDAVRGKAAFERLRCGNCHRIGDDAPAAAESRPIAIPRGSASVALAQPVAHIRGCLAADPAARGRAPWYDFTADEQRALRAFLADDKTPAGRRSHVVEDAERLVKSLRCGTCHARDDRSSTLPAIVADESERGLPPETIPNLTWTGEKLRTEWLRDFIGGKVEYRPRPWLKARMPAFPAYAETLAFGLALSHGIGDDSTPAVPSSRGAETDEASLAEAGSRLTFKAQGLDCRQCHGIGREQPTGDKGSLPSPGINFGHVRERMRHDFFGRFVLDPPRYDIGSRMPKLSADGRTTTATAILDGDAAAQFEALWQFVQTVRSPTEPATAAPESDRIGTPK